MSTIPKAKPWVTAFSIKHQMFFPVSFVVLFVFCTLSFLCLFSLFCFLLFFSLFFSFLCFFLFLHWGVIVSDQINCRSMRGPTMSCSSMHGLHCWPGACATIMGCQMSLGPTFTHAFCMGGYDSKTHGL